MSEPAFSIRKAGAALIIGAALAGSAAFAASVQQISGAGATFPYPLYAKWADTYARNTGTRLNYQSIGSGGGIKQISQGTVDFGASDAPLKSDELARMNLVQFPTVLGGVVPVVNLPDIKAGALRLTGPLLADIYLGKIKKWNDEAIKKINPEANLPDRAITVVHRSDGSGTTWIFTSYLSKVSPDWQAKAGNDKSVSWPTGVGGKGNEGVSSYVQRIPGAIGYVEYAYAIQNKLVHASLQNKDGRFVEPTDDAFQAAAASADWNPADGFYVVLTNQGGGRTWPISGATFILMQRQPRNPEVARAVLDFFDWSYREGDKIAVDLHYVPLPGDVVSKVRKYWASEIKDGSGVAMWKGSAGEGSTHKGRPSSTPAQPHDQ
jgi:phosphate transport system substrate-binding protein